jgi:4-hydroxy-tetrahydrodipicolinate reductase
MRRPLRVGVNGAAGRMGRITVVAIETAADQEVAFRVDSEDDLAAGIADSGADVVVDFTLPSVVFENVRTIIRCGARPVVGTTGLTADDLETIDASLRERGLGGIVAPNFSLGAVLSMKLAELAAPLFAECEIIEMHHEKKVDAPSGTAILTAERIAAAAACGKTSPAAAGGGEGSRGGLFSGIPVHSVRLPGKMAHQEVIFGGMGETLTIRHDALSRECFLPGILHAIRRVSGISGLEIGLQV